MGTELEVIANLRPSIVVYRGTVGPAGPIGPAGPQGPPGPPGSVGSLLDDYLAKGHRLNGEHRFGKIVTEWDADNTGATDAGAAINAAIADSDPGEAIIFPGGTYTMEETLLVKADRAYLALGDVTLRQKNATELDSLVAVDPAEAYPRRNIHWNGIHLDGNRTNNTEYTAGSGYANNRGMVLKGVQFSNFIDFAARHCGNDGLVFTGVSSDFSETSSTNHFVSPYVYDCGRYGVSFDAFADDNHLFGADLGYNDFGAGLFLGGSNSLRDCTCWGTKFGPGLLIGASSNQVQNCQIEGNAQHGISITEYGSSILIAGNKIYYNGLEADNSFDGIYVQGTALRPCDGIQIIGNYIHQGVESFNPSPDIRLRHAITLDTHHTNAVIEGNSLSRIGLSMAPDLTNALVYGLTTGDQYNGRRFTDSGTIPTNIAPGEVAYEKDTGRLLHYSEYRTRVERLLTSGHATDGGSFPSTTAGLTFVDITFSQDRFDTAYTPIVATSWDTRVWITAKASTGFRINFSTATPAGGVLDWSLVRQGV